jgi:hypothetical protein
MRGFGLAGLAASREGGLRCRHRPKSSAKVPPRFREVTSLIGNAPDGQLTDIFFPHRLLVDILPILITFPNC